MRLYVDLTKKAPKKTPPIPEELDSSLFLILIGIIAIIITWALFF